MIIDVRCRYTADDSAIYFSDRMAHVGRLDRIPALNQRSADAFFAEIEGAGITTAVSVSGCNPGARLGRYDLPARTTSNDALGLVQQAHPGRFLAVAGIDASSQFHDALQEIERCADQWAMRAIALEPGRAPGCVPSDRRLYPIYELCQSLNLALILQTSGVLGGQYVSYADPHHVEVVAEDFPRLRVICGHGCSPFVREAIVMAARRDNVWLSPDGYFFHLGHEDWVRAIRLNLGGFTEKFLFGSAYPLTPIAPFVENFRKVGWDDEVLRKLFYRNALTALDLERDPVFRAQYGLV